MILSHGNALVGSCVYINEDIFVANMKENALVAQQFVYDSIRNEGSILNIKW